MAKFKRLNVFFAVTTGVLIQFCSLFAQSQVVPCQLSNPDQDTLRLFPERTNYRTEFMRTDEVERSRNLQPKSLYLDLENRLGDSWDPIWETEDIPYVFYEILKGPERIGWVFGANQGWPGADNAQLMLGFDLDERIREFYYQKLPSLENLRFQSKQFYSQFIGISLENFYVHERLISLNIKSPDLQGLDMIQRIQDPSQDEHEGFFKTLRGLKKILIYLDDFKFHNKIKKSEVFYDVDYIVNNRKNIPFLDQDQILKAFPDASRFVVDLVAVRKNKVLLEERLEGPFGDQEVYPVYTVYKDVVYAEPFVRGSLLGYVVPFRLGAFTGSVSVGAQEKDKGKILSLNVNHNEFPQLKGLSLVHYYIKDFLKKTNITDEKLDKIAPLVNLQVEGQDRSAEIQSLAKKALILVDENYFHNYFKKDDIMKKIEEFVKKEHS